LKAKRICVAKIGAAHGVRGEVKLFAFTDDPLALGGLGPLEDETGARSFRILSLRPAAGYLVARLESVNDRTAAERLTHLKLYVYRERLPAIAGNSFYHADLVGLRVEAKNGEPLGKVAAVHNFGAGDLLEILPAKGGESVMLPFLDRFVPVVDVTGGRVIADPPAGMFDDEKSPHPPRGLRRSPPSLRKAGRGKAKRSAEQGGGS
jgi:16S rRNA processing protein RimM